MNITNKITAHFPKQEIAMIVSQKSIFKNAFQLRYYNKTIFVKDPVLISTLFSKF